MFEAVDGVGRSWGIFGDASLSTVAAFPYVSERRQSHLHSLREFLDGCRDYEKRDDLPDYCWLVPEIWGQSQHPGCAPGCTTNDGMLVGDNLIAAVYDAIRGNEQLWQQTLLVVTYDEAGGYYDSKLCNQRVLHPDAHSSKRLHTSWCPNDNHPFSFDWLGPRVPCHLVSAWLDHRVDHTLYEHA